jgi:hypothetical protein
VYYADGVSQNGTIFIFNGRERTILEFDETSETVKIIADLPFLPGTSSVTSKAAIPKGNDSVWLFNGDNPNATNPVLLFDTAKKVAYIPTANSTSPPSLWANPASVWSESHGYLVGGFGRLPESNGSYHPTNGILR